MGRVKTWQQIEAEEAALEEAERELRAKRAAIKEHKRERRSVDAAAERKWRNHRLMTMGGLLEQYVGAAPDMDALALCLARHSGEIDREVPELDMTPAEHAEYLRAWEREQRERRKAAQGGQDEAQEEDPEEAEDAVVEARRQGNRVVWECPECGRAIGVDAGRFADGGEYRCFGCGARSAVRLGGAGM